MRAAVAVTLTLAIDFAVVMGLIALAAYAAGASPWSVETGADAAAVSSPAEISKTVPEAPRSGQ